MRFLAPSFGVWLMMFALTASADPSKSKRTLAEPPPIAKRAPAAKAEEPAIPPYRYKLNTGLGVHFLKQSGVVVGSQFGVSFSSNSRLYLGPEFSFTLFEPGSILNLMATGWYELPFSPASRLGASLGLAAGVVFTSNLTYLPTTSYATFVDIVIWQEVDDLVALRGQFRPGLVGGYFSFVTNFNVSFRFF